MTDKRLILVFGIIGVLLLASAVFAEETPKVLTTKGIQTFSDETTKITTYTFTKAGDSIRINGEDYWNIQPSSSKTPAYIKTDANGAVSEAKFYTNENGGTYVFGSDKVNVPPNSGVLFKNGTISIFAPENATLANLPTKTNYTASSNTIVFRGKNLKLPGGAVLESGPLSCKDGQFYINRDDKTIISGVEISTAPGEVIMEGVSQIIPEQDRIPIFLGGEIPKDKGGVSIDVSNKILRVMKTPTGHPWEQVVLNQDNPFVKLNSNTPFKIVTPIPYVIQDSFSLVLQNRDNEGKIPEVTLSGNGQIIAGANSFYISRKMKEEYVPVLFIIPNWWQTQTPEFQAAYRQNLQSKIIPLEVLLKDIDGKTQDKKLIFTSSGEATFVPVDDNSLSTNSFKGTVTTNSGVVYHTSSSNK